MIGWVFSKTISELIGFVYPAYQSFKALQTPNPDDDTNLLMYWMVFSAMITFEHVFEFFISWIPFYWEFKVAFQIWLTFTTKGAKIIYEAYVRDLWVAARLKLDQYTQSKPTPESSKGFEALFQVPKTHK